MVDYKFLRDESEDKMVQDVMIVRLVSSEELIGNVKQKDDCYEIRKPAMIHVQQSASGPQIGLIPSLPLAEDPKAAIEIKNSHVLFAYPANKSISDAHIQTFSSIIPATSNLLAK